MESESDMTEWLGIHAHSSNTTENRTMLITCSFFVYEPLTFGPILWYSSMTGIDIGKRKVLSRKLLRWKWSSWAYLGIFLPCLLLSDTLRCNLSHFKHSSMYCILSCLGIDSSLYIHQQPAAKFLISQTLKWKERFEMKKCFTLFRFPRPLDYLEVGALKQKLSKRL